MADYPTYFDTVVADSFHNVKKGHQAGQLRPCSVKIYPVTSIIIYVQDPPLTYHFFLDEGAFLCWLRTQ